MRGQLGRRTARLAALFLALGALVWSLSTGPAAGAATTHQSHAIATLVGHSTPPGAHRPTSIDHGQRHPGVGYDLVAAPIVAAPADRLSAPAPAATPAGQPAHAPAAATARAPPA